MIYLLSLTLIILSLYDFKYKAVPDYLLLISLLLVFFVPGRALDEQLKDAVLFAGAFTLLNFILTFYIQNIKSRIYKDDSLKQMEALGEGDIPIIAVIGALLGVSSGVVAIFITGVAALIFIVITKNKDGIPFIPFLSLGMFIEYFLNVSTYLNTILI
jgi:leader peptidase (prepilin peptidase)/N-methyltransferase